MNRNWIILGLTLVSGNLLSETEIKGTPIELKQFLHPQENIVTIEGSATKTAYSDKAIVNVIIKTEQDLLADAIDGNAKLRMLVVEKLLSSGVKKENINNSKFSTFPQFGWFGKTPDSFEVINRMAISIFDENHLKLIAQLSDKYKEIELSGTSYEHTKKKEFELAAKKSALSEIMKQRSLYENTLGVKLKTVGIQDSRINQQPTFAAQSFEDTIVVIGSRTSKSRSRRQSEADRAIPTPRTFDEVEYEATLWVRFKVIQKD